MGGEEHGGLRREYAISMGTLRTPEGMMGVVDQEAFPASPSAPSSSGKSLPDSLDLATAVFICPLRTRCRKNVAHWGDCTTGTHFHPFQKLDEVDSLPARDKFPNPFFGWADAGLHHTCEVGCKWRTELKDFGELWVDKRGVLAVKGLIRILRMSEATTVQEMDARNAYFFCDGTGSSCATEPWRTVYTWRSAVSILSMTLV